MRRFFHESNWKILEILPEKVVELEHLLYIFLNKYVRIPGGLTSLEDLRGKITWIPCVCRSSIHGKPACHCDLFKSIQFGIIKQHHDHDHHQQRQHQRHLPHPNAWCFRCPDRHASVTPQEHRFISSNVKHKFTQTKTEIPHLAIGNQ